MNMKGFQPMCLRACWQRYGTSETDSIPEYQKNSFDGKVIMALPLQAVKSMAYRQVTRWC